MDIDMMGKEFEGILLIHLIAQSLIYNPIIILRKN